MTFQSPPDDIAFVSLAETHQITLDPAKRPAMNAGLEKLLELLATKGAYQMKGNFLKNYTDTSPAVSIATLEIKFNNIPPPIPKTWPSLPREFPVQTHDGAGTKLRIAKKGNLGDGWDRLHCLEILGVWISSCEEAEGQGMTAPHPFAIKVSDDLEVIIRYSPRAEYDGPSDLYMESKMLGTLKNKIDNFGAYSTTSFIWFDSTDRVIGHGLLKLLKGQAPLVNKSDAGNDLSSISSSKNISTVGKSVANVSVS